MKTDDGQIAAFRHQYEKTGNGLFAWLAYLRWRTLRRAGNAIDIPPWIESYLDSIALGLSELAQDPPTKDIARHIAKAMRLSRGKGGGSVFAQARKIQEHSVLYRGDLARKKVEAKQWRRDEEAPRKRATMHRVRKRFRNSPSS